MNAEHNSNKTCLTCVLTKRRDADLAPLWDNIYRTQYWDVAHSYNTSLLGWLVLIPRRHITSISELDAAERAELGHLLQQVSRALEEVTGCQKSYVLQFAEHKDHPHVHFHVVPRMEDQPDERRGARIMGYLGVEKAERVSEAEMNRVGEAVRQKLLTYRVNP